MDYIVINKLITKSIYKQIADSITKAIESGILMYNDKLPTEKEICEMFSISQTAVKKGYETLINNGLIKRIKGKGTYVTNRTTFRTNFHNHFELEKDDLVTKNTFLLGKSNKEYSVMRVLNLDDEEKYLLVGSVFCKDNNPRLLQQAYLPEKFFPKFEENIEEFKNIYDLIERYNIKVKHIHTTFSAYNASSANALLLNINPNDAVYLLKIQITNEMDEVIGYLINYYPGEFTEFEVIVHAID
jgi:GntR family transcriptional regulator